MIGNRKGLFDDSDNELLNDDELLSDDELLDDGELGETELLDNDNSADDYEKEVQNDEILSEAELASSEDITEENPPAKVKRLHNKDKIRKRNNNGINRKRKQKRVHVIISRIITLLMVLAAMVSVILLIKYTPTKDKMSGYDYFDVEDNDDTYILLNNVMSSEKAVNIDERIYIPKEYVEANLNKRFYYDEESDAVLLTASTNQYIFTADESMYKDMNGEEYSSEYPVVIEHEGSLYIALEYAGQVSQFTYSIHSEPNRVVINTDFSDHQYVDTKKKTAVRYRGGIKSEILENVDKGTQLLYSKDVDGWIEVYTPSGYKGYVVSSSVSDRYDEVKAIPNKDDFTSISKDYKIGLAWFQVTNKKANNNIDDLLSGTEGINTVSPTWYSISDNEGNMTSLADAAFVNKMHERGIEVWPLIDDFADELECENLYGSKSSRTNMINRLISDALQYGYDGINLDCEKVTKEGAKHFLQFVRELSIECKANNIVLSSDNYKPAPFNSYYDLKEQSAFADYIIIMGYDEHYAGSESGSVASIGFVEDGITEALKNVPKEKLINAVPLYTRIWTVSESATTSIAVGMQSAIQNLNLNNAPAIWDSTVGQYFGSYTNSAGNEVKIWLEEDRSIEEKMKLISKYELAGTAAWKLGLEKKSVWSVIAEYNQ